MAQTILLFRINRDKYAVIQNVCRTLGIRIIDVARKDYSQKLGTLAQIQGFTREAKKYDGPEFPAEMLIFSEMNSDQVDAFLAEYKKAGVEPIALKAVITGNNIFWTAERTQKELLHKKFTLFLLKTTKDGAIMYTRNEKIISNISAHMT